MRILLNVLGIADSGGITVLDKFITECNADNSDKKYFIMCNYNIAIKNIIQKYKSNIKLEFTIVKNKNIFYRLYYENIVFRKFIKKKI